MQPKPNILLIVMDSVRAANLSCYGYARATTPNIDKFAEEGTLFERTTSEGCWTLPVHTSLFTGLYPLNHGVTISKDALPEDYPTLAQILKEEGYQTCCFSNNAYISQNTGLGQGFDLLEDVWRKINPRGIKRTRLSHIKIQLRKFGKAGEPLIAFLQMASRVKKIFKGQKVKKDNGASLTNDMIKRWLSTSRDAEKPFYLFVNYMECHEKYHPPHPYDRKFMPSKYSPWRVLQVPPDKARVLNGDPRKKKEDLEIMTALYDGELNYLDHKIGELLEFLKSLNLLDNTVVIITSDHGDSLGEHEELGHRKVLFEQLTHVPLIVRYPERFKAGVRNSELVQLSDLFPTILELAGVASAKINCNGFQSLCKLKAEPLREFTISENTAPKSLNSIQIKSLKNKRYKFIWKSTGEHELYDLQTDPQENQNLINKETDIAAQLQAQLENWMREHENHQLEKREAVFDEALSERLRALGYVN